jgi:hypothetical protein
LLQSGVDHPGRAKVLQSQPKDPSIVIRKLLGKQNKGMLFLKNMAHHMINMDDALNILVGKFQHIFLIRDPKEILISLSKTLPNPTLRDTACQRQLELFEMVQAARLPIHVVDSGELLRNPQFVLSTLCSHLDISFEKSMLSWKPGPIPEDGIWAKYWYGNVHKSSGFKPYKSKKVALPDHLKPLYEKCKPIYDKLLAHAIKANV